MSKNHEQKYFAECKEKAIKTLCECVLYIYEILSGILNCIPPCYTPNCISLQREQRLL